MAKAGWIASRCQYVKSSGGRAIAVIHTGADLLMRTCYLPETWSLRVFVCDGTTGTSREAAADGAAGGKAGGAEAAAARGKGGGSGGPAGIGDAAAEEEDACCWLDQDVAGPLCFQGDRVAVARRLPVIRAGDFVMVVDAGAYTLSM